MYRFLYSNFFYILNSFCKICLEIFVPNRRIRRILKGEIAQNYLKKYVRAVVKENQNSNPKTEEINNYTIWQFWDKGIENAPDIVKRCVESIDKFEPNKRHVVLNMDNIEDYVSIPEKYYHLLHSGRMGMAHFSDILRTMLLIKHGGCWIDSTVLLTAMLPKYITNSDIFVFKNYEKSDLDGLNMASYFIHAKPNNKILKDTRDIIWKYWQDNNFLMNYFLYLHAFTLATKSNKENACIWNNIPFVSFIPVQHFQNELMNEFNEDRWKIIKSTTSIHKLSFKAKALGLNKGADIKNTFYEKLLKGELC